jgi:hypothetical protein
VYGGWVYVRIPCDPPVLEEEQLDQ